MQNILNVDELKVSWVENIHKSTHKKCHLNNCHSEIKLHMTLHTILGVVNPIVGGPIPSNWIQPIFTIK